jgi:hypothetical protein
MNIFVGIDGSPQGLAATRWAAREARIGFDGRRLPAHTSAGTPAVLSW